MSAYDYDCRDLFRLDGRTAIVTGGAGLLGETFVSALLTFGANVVIADLDGDAAAALGRKMRAAHGDRVLALRCDVADKASAERVIDDCVARFGGVDVLLNNAVAPTGDAARFFARFEDYELDEWRRQFAVNLDGAMMMAQAAGRRMLRQGRGGSIVQVASIYGVMASDNRIYAGAEYRGNQINNPAPYSASKAGLIGLTRWLAAYWAEAGIRVNAVAPGGVFTGENETFVRQYSARVPMGRMAHRHEILGTILYLASDASTYVTGQCLMVDGGLSAW